MKLHEIECFHLSPPNHPGFPDLLAVRDNKASLIEVKDFNKIGPKEKMFRIFTDAQPPFFLKMIAAKTPVHVVGLDGNVAKHFIVTSMKMIDDFYTMGRSEFLSLHSSILGSMMVLEP